eukprot:364243-Chlamydomonas_euryale.AAC.9
MQTLALCGLQASAPRHMHWGAPNALGRPQCQSHGRTDESRRKPRSLRKNMFNRAISSNEGGLQVRACRAAV